MEVALRSPGDLEELRRHVARERSAKQRDRYRALLLALAGLSTRVIQERLARSRAFVQEWVYRYRDGGLDALCERPRPGQPTKLPREMEAAFQARLEAGPREEDAVCALRGKDIQRILEQEFGVKYTLGGAYDLLHRLGYSCLRPRPRHRKNDPALMEQWKKDAPLLSRACNASIPAAASKCGSRTKAASASKAG